MNKVYDVLSLFFPDALYMLETMQKMHFKDFLKKIFSLFWYPMVVFSKIYGNGKNDLTAIGYK
jgi:chemotaxis response regulator CheB